MRALVACVVLCAAHAARANCSVNSTAATAIADAGVDLTATSDPFIGTWNVQATLDVQCTDMGTSCNTSTMQWDGNVTVVFEQAQDFVVSILNSTCAWSPTRAANGNGGCVMSGIRGVHGKVRGWGRCSENGGASSMTDYVYTRDFVAPPTLTPSASTIFFSKTRFAIGPNDIRVGDTFRLMSGEVWPAGTDTVTFRVEGAGMSVTQRYGAAIETSGAPKSQATAWAYDPASVDAVVTQPGDFQFWVELNGVKSEVRTFHANATSTGAGGGGGGSQASTGGGGGGSTMPSGGCSVGGIEAMVLLALLIAKSPPLPRGRGSG
ncbi:MAG: hypothetical protein QM817_36605 [Archangium sp.]